MGVAWFSSAFRSAAETLEDMSYAYEEDVPPHTLPTRAQFSGIPVVGRLFRRSCNLGDVIRVNGRFFREYVGWLPWIMATPALAPTAPALAAPFRKGVTATKAAVLALVALMLSR